MHQHLLKFIVLTICWSLTANAFDKARTDSYFQKAEKLKLAQNMKWLKLGHYEKTLFGYESIFRGYLFIHEDGYKSPELELKETIQAFFTDNYQARFDYKRPPQCQFLARRNWLVKMLEISKVDILPCEERETWKKHLSATAVSIIFASADLGNPASSFGHTFLKLSNPANAYNKELIDYGVNFAGNGNESDWFYSLRGLFGFYGGIYTMLPYHQKIREYINLEGRDLVEYKLSFTPEEVDELVNHLMELQQSTSPYYFFTKNCSYQLLTLFETIRPELQLSNQLTFWIIPVDTVKTVNEKSNLIVSKKHTRSLNSDYLEHYSHLNIAQKKALDELIAKQILTSDYDLTIPEKGEVYDTAMKYLAVRAFRTGEELESKKYELEVHRASLGQLPERKFERKEFAPELSHDSSAIYLGRGQIQGSNYTSLKFRPAFHDLEQPDMGMVPMSNHNVFTLEGRYYEDTKKYTLDHLTILSLLNTTPVTQLDKNFSWKSRLELIDQWRPDAEYSLGYSFELGYFRGTRISQLISARYTKDPDKHTYQAGPEVLLITRPTDEIGLSLDLTYFAEYQNVPYLRFNTKINYEISRNLDIQLQASDRRDYQLSIVKNFIF